MEKYNKEYHRSHYHLRTKYGKATKCEGKNCNGKSKNYEWALKKGKEYSNNPKDYFQLCKSCHSKYDYKGGQVISKQHKEKLRQVMLGRIPPNKGNDSRITRICVYCEKEYKTYRTKNKKYCNLECRNKDLKGKLPINVKKYKDDFN